jgi:hypothetical protein
MERHSFVSVSSAGGEILHDNFCWYLPVKKLKYSIMLFILQEVPSNIQE